MSLRNFTDLHSYHLRIAAEAERDELFDKLLGSLDEEQKRTLLCLDDAYTGIETTQWDLYRALRRLGVKERAAQRIATGEADR